MDIARLQQWSKYPQTNYNRTNKILHIPVLDYNRDTINRNLSYKDMMSKYCKDKYSLIMTKDDTMSKYCKDKYILIMTKDVLYMVVNECHIRCMTDKIGSLDYDWCNVDGAFD